jgi:hypothetical protein
MVRVQKNGTHRDFRMGSSSKHPPAMARQRACEIRTRVELGLDPLFERQNLFVFRALLMRQAAESPLPLCASRPHFLHTAQQPHSRPAAPAERIGPRLTYLWPGELKKGRARFEKLTGASV